MNDTFRRQIRANINRHGRTILGITGACGPHCAGNHEGHITQDNIPPDFVPYLYTIGNTDKNFPELILFFDPPLVDILNRLSQIMIDRRSVFKHGEQVFLSGPIPVTIVDVDTDDAKVKYTPVARSYYRGRYRLQQVLLPDPMGRLPSDPECDAPYRNQPILAPVPVFPKNSRT